MARAIWKGAITFGLVHVPVELYPAEERREFKFAMLDKRDFSPVGYKRYSKKSGKEVPWNDIVKGYEYDKDQYVVLSDEDFRRANTKASQTIEIETFVPAGEIPAEFFETPYYLAPGARGEKVYALLRESLRSTNRVAVAQVVIRTTQHLAVVAPSGRMLMLYTLRYPDELRDTEGLSLPAEGLKGAGVTTKEVDLAKRLIDDMTQHWKPGEFHNTYHEDLMRRIKEKIKAGQTKEITKPEPGEKPERRSAEVIDLAELLRQSLGKGETPRKSGARAGAKSNASARRPPLRIVSGRGSESKPAAKRKRA
jgi:DNA end-binding protein Ku